MPGWTSSASTDRPVEPRDARRRAPVGTSNRLRALKAAVFAAALLPLARLVAAGTTGALGGLGANPVEFVTRSTGTWTLVFLCITLAITPLRRISGWRWPQRLRRMLGLFAFFYGLLHFTTYLWFDQWFALRAIVLDVIDRPFITAGFIAFVLMVPLAATSTDAMVRRLGRQWSQLHRLVDLIAPFGVLHFWWHKAGKNDLAEPAIYATVVIVLLGWRVFDHLRRR
jgi:methionine sulfoxide reductase heme-binding subunit